MNLYFVFYTHKIGYDEYDSAVICTTSAKKALLTNPDNGKLDFDWEKVEYIGKAKPNSKKRVVCASFNAG